jgi:hypothetical protein
MDVPIVVSFHTNGRYRKEAMAMKGSAEAFGMEVHLEERPDLGSHVRNAAQKPAFLRAMRLCDSKPSVGVAGCRLPG